MKTPNEFWRAYMSGRLQKPCDFLASLKAQRSRDSEAPEASDRFLKGAPDDVRFTAAERLKVGPAYFTRDSYLRQQHRADYQQVSPELMVFGARLVFAFRKKQVPLYVHSAFRTAAEQKAAFDRGVSKVKWPHASHCQGAALDIVHGSYHWDMNKAEWDTIGHVGKIIADRMGLQLTWGGDWSFWDPAHWELADWRDNVRPLQAQAEVRLTPAAIVKLHKGLA